MKTYRTYSSLETKQLGRRAAHELLERQGGRALVIALRGDLGAGKTTFTQGFLGALGITKRVPSPTFVIMKRYRIRHAHFANAHHMDAYRLRKADDAGPLGFDAILKDPQNIVLVEWPENITGALPRGTKNIRFTYGKKENERVIRY